MTQYIFDYFIKKNKAQKYKLIIINHLKHVGNINNF